MPEVDSIAVECPSCLGRFRLKKSVVDPRTKKAVRCPSCAGVIRIPDNVVSAGAKSGRATQQGSPGTGGDEPSDRELRALLKQARQRKRSSSSGGNLEPDTQPSINVGFDTEPDAGATLPIGHGAKHAREFGTAHPGVSEEAPPAPPARPRMDTPRAGARITNVQRHEPDEPTFVGPAPGRAPKVTPTEKDLARFLVPGNYYVRVEDVVYAPVPHETVAELVDAGVLLGVHEIAAEDREWTMIAAGGPLGGLRDRLTHRAHHMLARVASGRPASEYDRPALADLANNEPVVSAVPEPPVPEQAPPVEPTEAMAAAPPAPYKKPSRVPIVLLTLTLVVAVGVATIAIMMPERIDPTLERIGLREPEVIEAAPEPTPTGVTLAQEPAVEEPPPPPDPTPAFQSALAAVTSAAARADTIEGLLDTARGVEDEALVTRLTWMKWLRAPEAVDAKSLVQDLMKGGEYRQARQVGNWLLATGGENEELRATVSEAVKKQFAEESIIEIEGDQFARFVRVDTGNRPALILEDKDAQRWAFWPDLGNDNWRGDIAVYRLCQLMVCHFAVPETRSATIDKKAWKALLKKTPGSVAEMVKQLRSDFDWSKKGVLSGSLRRLPSGAPWPIEATGIWRPWLTAGTGTSKLPTAAAQAHHEVAFFGAERVIPELDSVTARLLARQIADLLLVDYLVGNFNRFAPNEEDWGTRTYIDDGLIFSVDDSAAFLSEDSVRVRGRFSWASRFSRTTIDSLKSLDPEEVAPLLFPDASKAEKEKLDSLWSQRRKALRRIDKLVKKYGADDVYSLDSPIAPKNP